ncbi:Ras- protein Rab-18-B [Lobulomyces angularis]|nr:Ras- protein Rab-18-B [Lobulomyces angularis]
MNFPHSDNEVKDTFKILMIGDSGTGKSSLLLRFTDDKYLPQDQTKSTIGVDFKLKILTINGKNYKLTIWDTAGQERFRTLTSSYYKGAQGVILVYDVSNRTSFENLQFWFSELEAYSSPQNPVVKMIVGNKIDVENREVERIEGENLAKKLGTLFIETSAKSKFGVIDSFTEICEKIIEKGDQKSRSDRENVITINSGTTSPLSNLQNSCSC